MLGKVGGYIRYIFFFVLIICPCFFSYEILPLVKQKKRGGSKKKKKKTKQAMDFA